MKFDKVQIEHITPAIEDFNSKGLPKGFKVSAYFDIEIDGGLYPANNVDEVYTTQFNIIVYKLYGFSYEDIIRIEPEFSNRMNKESYDLFTIK